MVFVTISVSAALGKKKKHITLHESLNIRTEEKKKLNVKGFALKNQPVGFNTEAPIDVVTHILSVLVQHKHGHFTSSSDTNKGNKIHSEYFPQDHSPPKNLSSFFVILVARPQSPILTTRS